MKDHARTCAICGATFYSKHAAKFCSEECRAQGLRNNVRRCRARLGKFGLTAEQMAEIDALEERGGDDLFAAAQHWNAAQHRYAKFSYTRRYRLWSGIYQAN